MRFVFIGHFTSVGLTVTLMKHTFVAGASLSPTSVTTQLMIEIGPLIHYPISLDFSLPYTTSTLDISSLLTSIDFYALGYCIAHSRGIQARSNDGAEALEMLVSGLKNESKHHLETCSFQGFAITDTDLSVGVAWPKELLCAHLSELTLIRCRLCPQSCELLAQAIPMMPNLHSLLNISSNRNIGPGGAVSLLESLCFLKQLECLKVTETNIGFS